MPIFKYTGYRTDGSELSGMIEAEGIKDAVFKLKQDAILPKDIQSLSPTLRGRFFVRERRGRLAHVTRQLSVLLASGVSLRDALRSLSDENKSFWKSLLVDIREAVSSGSSLSRAMEEHRDVFPEFYTKMVHAGETGGMLDDVLMRLADFLEKDVEIRSKVSNAMVYPLFMFSIGMIVLSFVFTFVVPKIVVIFQNAKTALPMITVVLIKISSFLNSYWWLLLIVFAGSVYASKKLYAGRPQMVDRILLKFPIAYSLYISRFTRILGFLLSGGISLLKSLELSAKSTGNSTLRQSIIDASKNVAEGASIASSLQPFPPVLRQMIATGEKTGRLPELLDRAANTYEEEFSKKVQMMLTLLEPSMIVVMGLIVGFIVFAVLLPLFQMNQLIR